MRLALVVIARDEAATIGRCLASAADLVDHMLVLDTGSTDQTASIAADCGAAVHHFEWCDDFSAARNHALDLAGAEWNLVVDADEWIENGGDRLAGELTGQEPFLGIIPVTSEFDLDGKVELATSWMPRILPRGVRYTGRIHEYPVSDLERKRIELVVRHDGYRQSRLELKAGRNRRLLLAELELHPDDAYFLYQTGKDCEIYHEYGTAADHYRHALEHIPGNAGFRHDLVVRLIYCLKQTGQFEQAIEFTNREMPSWQHSPDFFFAAGDMLLACATQNPDNAQELLPMIEACWSKCLEIGERPELEGAVQGRGSHLAAHNLAVMYESLGDQARMEHYRELAAELRGV